MGILHERVFVVLEKNCGFWDEYFLAGYLRFIGL